MEVPTIEDLCCRITSLLFQLPQTPLFRGHLATTKCNQTESGNLEFKTRNFCISSSSQPSCNLGESSKTSQNNAQWQNLNWGGVSGLQRNYCSKIRRLALHSLLLIWAPFKYKTWKPLLRFLLWSIAHSSLSQVWRKSCWEFSTIILLDTSFWSTTQKGRVDCTWINSLILRIINFQRVWCSNLLRSHRP